MKITEFQEWRENKERQMLGFKIPRVRINTFYHQLLDTRDSEDKSERTGSSSIESINIEHVKIPGESLHNIQVAAIILTVAEEYDFTPQDLTYKFVLPEKENLLFKWDQNRDLFKVNQTIQKMVIKIWEFEQIMVRMNPSLKKLDCRMLTLSPEPQEDFNLDLTLEQLEEIFERARMDLYNEYEEDWYEFQLVFRDEMSKQKEQLLSSLNNPKKLGEIFSDVLTKVANQMDADALNPEQTNEEST